MKVRSGNFYAIKHQNGSWSQGGEWPQFGETPKLWTLGHLKNHLIAVMTSTINRTWRQAQETIDHWYRDCEIVEIKVRVNEGETQELMLMELVDELINDPKRRWRNADLGGV